MPSSVWWTSVAESTGLEDFIRIVNRRMRPVQLDSRAAVCEIHLDGGGAALTTGIKLDIAFPNFDCTIVGWELVADQSGSIVIDLWKDTYGNYPPTVADTITASAKPTLASATKNKAASVPTWTTKIVQGDTLRVNIDSVTTVTRVTLALSLVKV